MAMRKTNRKSMPPKVDTGFDRQLDYAEDRLRLFEKQVDQEPWKTAHVEAMRCLAFQDALAFGIALYDLVIDLDDAIRGAVLRREVPHDPKYDVAVRKFFRWWLKPCGHVERDLLAFEKQGFVVDHADEFRKRYDEATWMLKPAGEAFDHPKMVDARDIAIDEVHAAE